MGFLGENVGLMSSTNVSQGKPPFYAACLFMRHLPASIPFLPFPLFYAPAKWEAGLGLMSPTGDFFPGLDLGQGFGYFALGTFLKFFNSKSNVVPFLLLVCCMLWMVATSDSSLVRMVIIRFAPCVHQGSG